MNDKTKLESYNLHVKDIQGILIKLKSLRGVEDIISNIEHKRNLLEENIKKYSTVSNKGKGLSKQKTIAKKMYDWAVLYRSDPQKALKADISAKLKNKNITINTKALQLLSTQIEPLYVFLNFLPRDFLILSNRIKLVKDKLSKFDSAIGYFTVTEDDLPNHDELADDDGEATEITDIIEIEPTKTTLSVKKAITELTAYVSNIKQQRKELIDVILFFEEIDIVDIVKQQKTRYEHTKRLFLKLKTLNKMIYDGGLDHVKNDYIKLLKISLTVLPHEISDKFKTKLNLKDKSELDLLIEQSPKFVRETVIPAHAKIKPTFTPERKENRKILWYQEPKNVTKPSVTEPEVKINNTTPANNPTPIGEKLTPAEILMYKALWDD